MCVGLRGNRGQAHTAACGQQIRKTWRKASNMGCWSQTWGRVKESEPKPQRTGPQGVTRNAAFKDCMKWGVAQSRLHRQDSNSHKISLCCLEGGRLTGPPSNLAAPARSPSLEWLWVALSPPSALQNGAVCLRLLLTSETLVLGAPQLNLSSLRHLGPSLRPTLEWFGRMVKVEDEWVWPPGAPQHPPLHSFFLGRKCPLLPWPAVCRPSHSQQLPGAWPHRLCVHQASWDRAHSEVPLTHSR